MYLYVCNSYLFSCSNEFKHFRKMTSTPPVEGKVHLVYRADSSEKHEELASVHRSLFYSGTVTGDVSVV